MNYLIINQLADLDHIDDHVLFFIDTEFTSQYFLKLVDHAVTRQIKVYKRTNNIFANILIEAEREKIVTGSDCNLEHYHLVDFLKNEYNHYLNIVEFKPNQTSKLLAKFRGLKQSEYDNQTEHNNHLVYKLHDAGTDNLLADLELFHHTTDASAIAFSTNSQRFFKCVDELEPTEVVVSESNLNASNRYLILPQAIDYLPITKLLYVESIDYLRLLACPNLTEYILDLPKELAYNQYVRNFCNELKIKTTDDLELSSLCYQGQDYQLQQQIYLVEKDQRLDVYKFNNGEISLVEKIDKYTYQYQKMVLNYKNDIYYEN